MKTTILLILTSLIFSSCATLLNSRTDSINIVTNEPTKIKVANDTLPVISKDHFVTVDRSKDSLEILAFSEQNKKSVKIKSRNSFAYWLNLYPSTAWTGFLIDKNNPKRYNYPETVYIDLNDSDNDYLTYKPLDSTFAKYTSILKLTPLRTVSIINSGFEISYEKKLSNSFSTQIMASYLLPVSLWDLGYEFKPEIKGFQIAFEEKYYLKKSAPLGLYMSFEFNYLQNEYSDIGRFAVANIYSDTLYNNTNYTDTIGIRKKTYSFNLKLGYQYIINRFSIDIYAGLGARYKDVIHTDRLKPEDEMEIPGHPNVYYITNKDGQYWTISIPLNIRIGWTF